MNYEFKPSFDRSVKSLPPEIKQDIKKLCISLIDVLSGEQELSVGIGLKNLKKNFWEIRKGLKLRILFRWQTDHVEFLLAGTHEEIKRYLKTYIPETMLEMSDIIIDNILFLWTTSHSQVF